MKKRRGQRNNNSEWLSRWLNYFLYLISNQVLAWFMNGAKYLEIRWSIVNIEIMWGSCLLHHHYVTFSHRLIEFIIKVRCYEHCEEMCHTNLHSICRSFLIHLITTHDSPMLSYHPYILLLISQSVNFLPEVCETQRAPRTP